MYTKIDLRKLLNMNLEETKKDESIRRLEAEDKIRSMNIYLNGVLEGDSTKGNME